MTHLQSKLTDNEIAYRAVMLKALIGVVMDEFDSLKRMAGDRYERGTSIGAFDDLTELGSLGKDIRKPVPKVVDKAEFEGWLSVKHGDEMQRDVVLGDHAEIAAVLADTGHDDLYSVVEIIPDELVKKALKLAAKGGHVPGVELHHPESVVSARPTPDAVEKVRELLASSAVPLLSIEGGA